MNKKNNRFLRLECSPIIKVFKKPKESFDRFTLLEVDGHKIEIGVKRTSQVRLKFIDCPKCKRRNPENSLYCLYCDFTFGEKVEGAQDLNLEQWEIKCADCGRFFNRHQNSCIYCGWQVSPGESAASAKENIPQSDSTAKKRIVLNIDGREYSSTDKYLPSYIKELMDRIEKEGYSEELVNNWMKDKNMREELSRHERMSALPRRLRVLWLRLVFAAALIIGLVVLHAIFFRFTVH